MKHQGEEVVFSRNVVEMITVANEFCLFAEEADGHDNIRIWTYLEKVFPLLYLKGSLLPAVEVSDESANQRFVTEEEWEQCYRRFIGKFDKLDPFYANAAPDKQECTLHSLAELIADIYQDMKDFLHLYQVNTMAARENAVSSCRQLYRSHWGPKLLRAEAAIHHILYGNETGVDFPGYLNN